MHLQRLFTIPAIILSTALLAPAQNLPRTAGGKPDLQGIWQATSTAGADLQDHVASLNMLAGRSVVEGGSIPYQPWAAKQRDENFKTRLTADPYLKCYMPGVPRIMYLDYPFQIFQTPKAVAMAFEWELDFRMIYTDGTKHPGDGSDFWMGDSRGHWDGDTLVVDVSNARANRPSRNRCRLRDAWCRRCRSCGNPVPTQTPWRQPWASERSGTDSPDT